MESNCWILKPLNRITINHTCSYKCREQYWSQLHFNQKLQIILQSIFWGPFFIQHPVYWQDTILLRESGHQDLSQLFQLFCRAWKLNTWVHFSGTRDYVRKNIEYHLLKGFTSFQIWKNRLKKYPWKYSHIWLYLSRCFVSWNIRWQISCQHRAQSTPILSYISKRKNVHGKWQ